MELKKDDSIYILIGNKIDLNNRVITTEEAQKYADENKILYMEISAKTGEGFHELFEDKLINLIIDKYNPGNSNGLVEDLGVKLQPEKKEKVDNVNDNNTKTQKKKKCC